MKSIIVRFKLHMNMIKPLSEYFYSSLKLSLCSILILFGLLPHSVTAGQDQWTKVGTLNTSIGYMYVNALSEIYVMSWRDSLHRYDGLVWESIETGLDASLAVTSFAYSDAGDKTLYVSGIGSTNPYVYQTSNGGNTWSLKTTGVVDDFVITVAADPNNTQVAWLGTDINGVYKTVNGGDSWVAKNNGFGTEGTLNRITVAPGNSSVVYAAGAHLGVFKTTDGGDNWTLLTDNAIFVNTLDAMVVNPANANQVFFITDSNELYRVTDNGSSVSEELFMDGMPVDTTLGSLVIDKNNSAIMYAGTLNGVYEWDNINTTWNKLKIG
ncbi:MAG: hypothetical protein OEZ33_09535, partial [Gammaproteobacteria bacterium]|nr:hypothetical protein [Gammaproteobacteria bacterium]